MDSFAFENEEVTTKAGRSLTSDNATSGQPTLKGQYHKIHLHQKVSSLPFVRLAVTR